MSREFERSEAAADGQQQVIDDDDDVHEEEGPIRSPVLSRVRRTTGHRARKIASSRQASLVKPNAQFLSR
jgi:hypothetical protein